MRKLPRLSLAQLAILLAVIVVGYFIFSAVGDVLVSQRLNKDEQRLLQEIAELQRQGLDLEAIRDYLLTDEYIEGVARRTLGLVRPGDTLVVVTSSVAPTPNAERPPDTRPWWEKLFDP